MQRLAAAENDIAELKQGYKDLKASCNSSSDNQEPNSKLVSNPNMVAQSAPGDELRG